VGIEYGKREKLFIQGKYEGLLEAVDFLRLFEDLERKGGFFLQSGQWEKK